MSTSTPPRSFRIPDDEWDEAVTVARQEGVTVTELVRELLHEHVHEFKMLGGPTGRSRRIVERSQQEREARQEQSRKRRNERRNTRRKAARKYAKLIDSAS